MAIKLFHRAPFHRYLVFAPDLFPSKAIFAFYVGSLPCRTPSRQGDLCSALPNNTVSQFRSPFRATDFISVSFPPSPDTMTLSLQLLLSYFILYTEISVR